MLLALALTHIVAATPTSEAASTSTASWFALVPPGQELILHGFRNPGLGLELRQGPLGLHAVAYPTVIDANADGEDRTTWFARFGLTAYFLGVDTGVGRWSSLYLSASLLQGLNNAHDVSESVERGTAAFVDAGARWAVWSGLEVRLGVGVQLGFDGELLVRPTPGISWATAF